MAIIIPSNKIEFKNNPQGWHDVESLLVEAYRKQGNTPVDLNLYVEIPEDRNIQESEITNLKYFLPLLDRLNNLNLYIK